MDFWSQRGPLGFLNPLLPLPNALCSLAREGPFLMDLEMASLCPGFLQSLAGVHARVWVCVCAWLHVWGVSDYLPGIWPSQLEG